MARRLLCAALGLALLMFCPAALSTTYFHVYAPIQMPSGGAVAGADIHVHAADDTTTVAIYSDAAGATTITQPHTTDANGMMDFYTRPGVYDIVITKTAWAIDDTLTDYWVGGGSTALADSLILLGDATTNKATLQFGTLTDTSCTGRLNIPINGVLWVMRDNEDAQRYTDSKEYIFGIGESEVQYQEKAGLNWAVADRDSAIYHDRPMILMDSDNATVADSDAYQGLQIRNDRSDTLHWLYGGYKGVWDGVYGTPNYGIRLQTDIPDSLGSTGQRDAVQIRWWMTPSSRHIHNMSSSFLSMYEHDTEHYSFRPNAFEMRMRTTSAHSWDVPKKLIWYGSPATNYAKMGLASATGNLTLYAGTVATVDVRTQSGTDAATLDASAITTHDLTATTSIAVATWKFGTVAQKGNLPAAASTIGGFYNDAGADSIWYSNGTTWTKVFPP